MQAATVLLAEPLGPCSKMSLLGRPSCAKLRERAVELALHFLLPDERVALRLLGALPRQIEELVARERCPTGARPASSRSGRTCRACSARRRAR